MVSGYNAVMQTVRARSPWLGQVRLVSPPALGHFEGDHLMTDWGTKDHPQSYPPQSVFAGREKCTFLGFWSEQHEFARTQGLEDKVKQFESSHEIKRLPASWPRGPFYPPGSVVPADMINGSEVWACPKLPVVVQPPTNVQPGTMPVQNLPPVEPPAETPAKASESYSAGTALAVGGIAVAGAVAAYFGMK